MAARNAATLEIAIEVDSKTGKIRLKELGKEGKKAGGDVESGFKRAGSAVSSLDKSTSKAISRMKSMNVVVAGLVGIGGFGMLAKGAIDTASSFEQLEMRLDVLTKGKGTETLDALNQWALKMPINTKEAVDAFVMMQAMGLDPTIDKLQVLVDTGVIFGEDAMKRIARALGQMQALGKVSAEELNQLSEVGINARKYLTREFGMTVEELQRAGVDINRIVGTIMDGLEAEFKGASQKGQTTWRGMTTAFESYWMEMNRKIMEAGVFDYLKDELGKINRQMANWIETNDVLIQQEVPKYVNSIKEGVSETLAFITSNKDLFEYGIIGLMIGGRKGAMLLGTLGYTSQLIENLDKAIQLNQMGLISVGDIAKSFYSNTDLNSLISSNAVALRRKELEQQLQFAKKYKGFDGKANQGLIDEAQAQLDEYNNKIELMSSKKRLGLNDKYSLPGLDKFPSFQKDEVPAVGKTTNKTLSKKDIIIPINDQILEDQAEKEAQQLEMERRKANKLLQMTKEYTDKKQEEFTKALVKIGEDITTEENAMEAHYEKMKLMAIDFATETDNILGDYLYSGLMGKWNDIGAAFSSMIARMGADLAQSQISAFLFGTDYKKGDFGGVAGIFQDWWNGGSKGTKDTIPGAHVVVNVHNYTSGEVETTQTINNDGTQIDIFLRAADMYIANGIRRGRSETGMAIEQIYNTDRASGLLL